MVEKGRDGGRYLLFFSNILFSGLPNNFLILNNDCNLYIVTPLSYFREGQGGELKVVFNSSFLRPLSTWAGGRVTKP